MIRRRVLPGVLALLAAAGPPPAAAAEPPGPPGPPDAPAHPHVLVVILDDLRETRHALGQPPARTPNLDRLAAEGVSFSHAFAPVPVCGASRASFLTGLRPTADRFTAHDSRVDADAPGAVTLPGFFAAHGYVTRGYGKVFHDRDDHLEGWTAGHFAPNAPDTSWRQYATPAAAAEAAGPGTKGPPTEEGRDAAGASLPDDAYHDGRTAAEVAGDLAADGRSAGRPVLYVVGFVKPHLPFVAPGRFWDLFGPADLDRQRPLEPAEGLPAAAMHPSGELRAFSGAKEGPPFGEPLRRHLLHGYLASAAYADAQLGRVLDALDDSGLADRTVVVALSDHGFLLGEQGVWTKHALFEPALRVPLVVRPAGRASAGEAGGTSGGVDASLVSLTDLLPTLAGLAGLPVPGGLDGRDLSGRILAPDPGPPLDDPVVSRWLGGVSTRTRDARETRWPGGETVRFDLAADPFEQRVLRPDAGGSPAPPEAP